jgi:helicase SWR1
LTSLTGADTVIFYDSDFNPQMDRQCEDRAHRIGQIRDVHIYRFVSAHTVEEALLRKADQKRALDELVIQRGGFDWAALLADAHEGRLADALGAADDAQDAAAAARAAREERVLAGADDADFEPQELGGTSVFTMEPPPTPGGDGQGDEPEQDAEEDGLPFENYMINWVVADAEFFNEWHI